MRQMTAPGQWIAAPSDPYASLTPRSRQILDMVRSTNGNRARAARYLGVSTTAVQAAMRRCAARGAPVPAPLPSRRGQPNLRPWLARPLAPRCGAVMRWKRVPCALRQEHPAGHRSPASVAKSNARRAA